MQEMSYKTPEKQMNNEAVTPTIQGSIKKLGVRV